MSAAQLAAVAGILGALGTVVASVTALIVALKAHGRIDNLQGQQPAGSPPQVQGPRQ